MFYIEIKRKFLDESHGLEGELEIHSKGKDEKEDTVVYLTEREKEIVELLREREVAFTIMNRASGRGITAPDAY